MPKESDPVKQRKIEAILKAIDDDEKVTDSARNWYRGCLSLAIVVEGEIQVWVYTANDLIRWFDAACVRMQVSGVPFIEAFRVEWPESRSDKDGEEETGEGEEPDKEPETPGGAT